MGLIKHTCQLVIFSVALSFSTIASAYSNANDQLDTALDLYDDHRFRDAAKQLEELVTDRGFRRLDEVEKYLARSHLAYSLMAQSKNRQSLRHVNQLLKRTEIDFGKQSEQYVHALLALARVHYRAGDNRNAIRAAEEMVSILTRLGDEFRDDIKDFRTIPSQIRRKNWSEEDQLKDLSDFYSTCEKISSGDPLSGVAAKMNDYLLVGKDYRPVGRAKDRFKRTYIKRARESSSDRANRLIFIPDEDHKRDWCVVYPDGKMVDRAAVVPPREI